MSFNEQNTIENVSRKQILLEKAIFSDVRSFA